MQQLVSILSWAETGSPTLKRAAMLVGEFSGDAPTDARISAVGIVLKILPRACSEPDGRSVEACCRAISALAGDADCKVRNADAFARFSGRGPPLSSVLG